MKYIFSLFALAFISSVSIAFDLQQWLQRDQVEALALSSNGTSILWYRNDHQGGETLTIQSLLNPNETAQSILLPSHEQLVSAQFGSNDTLVIHSRRIGLINDEANNETQKLYQFNLSNKKLNFLYQSKERLHLVGQANLTELHFMQTNKLWRYQLNNKKVSLVEDFSAASFNSNINHTISEVFLNEQSEACLVQTQQHQVFLKSDNNWQLINSKLEALVKRDEKGNQLTSQSIKVMKVLPSDHCNHVWLIVDGLADTAGLYRMDSRHNFELIYRHPHYDLTSFSLNKRSEKDNEQSLAAIYFDSKKPEVVATHQLMADLNALVTNEMSNAHWQVIDSNNDNSIFLLSRQSPTDKPHFVWVDVNNRVVKPIIEQNSKSNNIAPTEIIHTQNFTKTDLLSYLVMPKLKDGQKAPLIVRIHGGPAEVRDTLRFDPEAQWLAQQNVATLSINYRGSAGFGYSFQQQAFGQFRDSLKDDIERVIDDVVAKYAIEPSSIVLYGASFGGFAALNELIEPNFNYKGVVLFNSVTQLEKIAESISEPNTLSEFTNIFGDFTNNEWLIKNNLLNQLNQLKVEPLIVYSRFDDKVSNQQSLALIELLKKLNKPYQALELLESKHSQISTADALAYYEKLAEYLKVMLGAKIEAQPETL